MDQELPKKAYELTFKRRYATNLAGSVEDIVCSRNGEPLACMVLVDGKLQSQSIHYDGAIHHTRNVSRKEKMNRIDWIQDHVEEIRQGCLKLV